MRALLRLQATVAAWRVPANWPAFVIVSALLVSRTTAERGTEFWRAARTLGPLIAVIALTDLMGATLAALDSVRWQSPTSARRVYAAHLAFWAPGCSVVAAVIAILWTDSWSAGLVFCAGLALAGIATAAAVAMVPRRLLRRGLGEPISAGLVAAMAIVAALAVVRGSTHGSTLALVLTMFVTTAVVLIGARVWEHHESPTAPTSAADAGRNATSDRCADPHPARSPHLSILRTAWPPVLAVFWAVFAIGAQALPGPSVVAALAILSSMANLGTLACRSLHWLAATPIDRDRLFRRLFVPILLVAAAGGAARLLSTEFLHGDGTRFFVPLGSQESHSPRHRQMVLGHLMQVDRGSQTYGSLEPPVMARNVAEHLWSEYRLRVPPERIESTILQDWRTDFSAARQPTLDRQQAAFDAMDRVHAALEDEIRSADRLRSLLHVGLGLLGAVLLLRCVTGGVRAYWRWGVPPLTCVLVLWIASIKSPDHAAVAPLLDAWGALEGAFVASWTVRVAVTLAALAVAVFVWRSAARAFRRLDLTDLPPARFGR